MPGILRKLIIFATVDGLILQPLGGWDHHSSLRVDFKDRAIGQHAKVESETWKQRPHLESHGIIGLLTIASFSFLLCITRREQVAQIYGKPIYVIKDIAILPLSSQAEVDQAIGQNRAVTQGARKSQGADTASSGSEESEDDSFDSHSVGDPLESQSPMNNSLAAAGGTEKSTNVVQDVIQRKGQYGRFASQWFSRRGWGLIDRRTEETSIEIVPKADPADQASQPETAMPASELESSANSVARHPMASGKAVPAQSSSHEAAIDMLPKIIRTTKLLFTSKSFYFSYDFNITKRFGSSSIDALRSVSLEDMEQQYFWNRHLTMPFSKAGFGAATVPVMQGFVGQQAFVVKNAAEDGSHTKPVESGDSVLKANDAESRTDDSAHASNSAHPFLLTLTSRRSVKRSGLRYLRRGIDDEGNCANSVETEQILSSPSWEQPTTIRSFVQFRASIPLYFSQSPYAFKPVPILHQPPEVNRKAFNLHFQELRRRYGPVQIVLLVDRQGGEKKIGEEYERFAGGVGDLSFKWFDFHTECRGMKFENVQKLVHSLEDTMKSIGKTVVDGQIIKQTQTGIIRTNCMDCLDRTNVVQSAFAQHMLQKDLEREGFQIDFVHDPSTQWFNTLWADNGDAISRQYASTAALKGDYTRTRKRDYRGAMNDFGLTLTRYYNNIVNDYFSQIVIDLLLGNVTSRIFDDFEANMMSADPGISIDKVRQNAIDTCSKIVFQDLEEDLIDGWAVLTPARTNTLRTLPFEESILLLTDRAIYGCKFDWNTEKVASFERIDLRSVIKIHYGTYITSTLTEAQMNEDLNVGLVISYAPGRESIKRVNTRSLQVSDDAPADVPSKGSGDSAILSWLRARNSRTSCMAVKVIRQQSLRDEKIDSSPLAAAEGVCNKIKRVIMENTSHGGQGEVDLVEKADIISLAEARSRTGYLEQIGHSIKKLVWT